MPGGRPLKFKSVKHLQDQIDAFFLKCETDKLPYTITGLALALDTSRETLCDYEGKDEYSDAIKRAKLMCQNYAEQRLYMGGQAAGPIFALKNFGWSDKHEVEHSGHIATKDQRDAAVAAALSAEKQKD
jgi:hypothetical protein